MKKRRLSKRGKITLAAVGFVACLGLLSSLPNTDNYEVRTMKVIKKTEETTYLIDGNNHVYEIKDNVDETKSLYVTVDNRGTSDLTDDVVIEWRYKK